MSGAKQSEQEPTVYHFGQAEIVPWDKLGGGGKGSGKRGGPVVFLVVHYEICPPVTLDFSFLDVKMMGKNVRHHHVQFERDQIIIKVRRAKKVFFWWIDMMESKGSRECQGVMVGSADDIFGFLVSISIEFSRGKKFLRHILQNFIKSQTNCHCDI